MEIYVLTHLSYDDEDYEDYEIVGAFTNKTQAFEALLNSNNTRNSIEVLMDGDRVGPIKSFSWWDAERYLKSLNENV